jgi:uncharacterized protein (TIGR00251 family)
MNMKQTEKGVILEVRVKPKSSSFSISQQNGKITALTRSPAEDNKANMEIVKELSRLFGKDVRIVRGLKSRNKVILVEGASAGDVEKALLTHR